MGILACGLHHFLSGDLQLFVDQHPFDPLHQTVNEAHVALRDANDGGNRLLIRTILGISRDGVTPALREKKGRLLLGRRLHPMDKSNA